MIAAPQSRMDTITPEELKASVSASQLAPKYNQVVDSQSAYEILGDKLKQQAAATATEQAATPAAATTAPARPSRSTKEDDSFIESLSKNTMVRQAGRTAVREITRGLLGAFLGSGSRRR